MAVPPFASKHRQLLSASRKGNPPVRRTEGLVAKVSKYPLMMVPNAREETCKLTPSSYSGTYQSAFKDNRRAERSRTLQQYRLSIKGDISSLDL